MLSDEFRELADSIICLRVKNCSMRSYRMMMNYAENTYRETAGFYVVLKEDQKRDTELAELVILGIVNAFIAGTEDDIC